LIVLLTEEKKEIINKEYTIDKIWSIGGESVGIMAIGSGEFGVYRQTFGGVGSREDEEQTDMRFTLRRFGFLEGFVCQ
jgi:hypothetical protein